MNKYREQRLTSLQNLTFNDYKKIIDYVVLNDNKLEISSINEEIITTIKTNKDNMKNWLRSNYEKIKNIDTFRKRADIRDVHKHYIGDAQIKEILKNDAKCYVLCQATEGEIKNINKYCHEYLRGIKSKKFESKIINIPRVIYDLYALNFMFSSTDDRWKQSFNHKLPGGKDATYDDYCNIVWKLLYKINEEIWIINDEMKNNHYDFDKMFNEIFDIVLNIDDENVQFLKDVKNNSDLFKQILKTQLDLEKNHINSDNKIILYCGGSNKNDGIINIKNEDNIHSISYNLSLLNGVISDYKTDGACTIKYIYDTKICNYYVSDKSDVKKILFIPPLHPLLQLLLGGELFPC